ncbi:M48 family metalloprotease [Pandoraea capi]|nr:M48 family metalloprotease [Pandoraea capi]
MIGINAYPKIAKTTLFVFSVAFVLSVAYLFAAENLGFQHEALRRIAGFVCAVLLLPAFVTVRYVTSVVDYANNELQMTHDPTLAMRLSSVLDQLPHPVSIGVYHSEEINAFAISSIFGNRSVIGFSSALLSKASHVQLLAIGAHEVAHIRSGDSKSKAFVLAFNCFLRVYPFLLATMAKQVFKKVLPWMLGSAVLLLLLGIYWGDVRHSIESVGNGLLPFAKVAAAAVLVIIGSAGLGRLLEWGFSAYSREREFAADVGAAYMTGPQAMLSALDLLGMGQICSRSAISIFDSHPPIEERKRRIRKIAIGLGVDSDDSAVADIDIA